MYRYHSLEFNSIENLEENNGYSFYLLDEMLLKTKNAT